MLGRRGQGWGTASHPQGPSLPQSRAGELQGEAIVGVGGTAMGASRTGKGNRVPEVSLISAAQGRLFYMFISLQANAAVNFV